VELLVTLAVIGLLAGLGLRSGGESLARQRLEVASRRLAQGIERGRSEAEQQGEACGLTLSEQGWQPPQGGALRPCRDTLMELGEGVESTAVDVLQTTCQRCCASAAMAWCLMAARWCWPAAALPCAAVW